jgi:hypothetical protein
MCRGAVNSGRSLRLRISVGTVGTATFLWSMDRGMVSALKSWNVQITGSAQVTLFGTSLGIQDSTVPLRLGMTACETSDWGSSSSLRCRVSGPALMSRRLGMTAGLQIGTFSSAFSTGTTSISSITVQNLASTGANILTVYGSSFGKSLSSARMRLSSTSSSRSAWMSDTGIICRFETGFRQSRNVRISLGLKFSTSTLLFSFSTSVISTISVFNGASTGTISLTLIGSNIGTVASSSSVRPLSTSCQASQWRSDTAIRCLVSSSISQSRILLITSGGVLSSTSQSFSFNAPHLSGAGMYRNSYPYVPQMLTLFGLEFGVSDNSPLARVGLTACESSMWTSQSSMLCRIASGMAINDHITVTVGVMYSTISRVLIYDTPIISAACPQNCAISDPVQTTVYGLNFGEASVSNKLRIGGTPCVISMWISDTTMLCKPGSGYARPKWQLPVVLSLGNAAGFSPSDYTFSMTQVWIFIFFY